MKEVEKRFVGKESDNLTLSGIVECEKDLRKIE